MSQRFRRIRGSAGFTLVEMLVGLTLFALLSILLFGGFRFGLRAWEVGGERAEQASEIQLVQEMLRRQIAASQPAALLGTSAPQAPGSSFSGTSDTLGFVAAMPVRSEAAGLYRFEIRADEIGVLDRLEIGWSVFRLDQFAGVAPVHGGNDVLLEDIAEVRFSYFGRAVPSEAAQWVDRWDGSLGLPQLVRISVTFPPGDRRQWPDLYVTPRLRGSGP